MTTTLWPVMALTLFTVLGNAQDNAAPVSAIAGSPASDVSRGDAVRGNVAMSKVQHAADLQRAALISREQKALKEAMAASSPQPAPITTAEQFLAANRPPAAPPHEGGFASSRARTAAEVPEFKSSPGRVPAAGAKPGWFDLFKSKKGSAAKTEPGISASPQERTAASYPPPSANPAESSEPEAATATVTGQEAARAEATNVSDSPNPKPDFLSRIFGKGKKAESSFLAGGGDEGTSSAVPAQNSIPTSGPPAGQLEEGTPVPTTAAEN